MEYQQVVKAHTRESLDCLYGGARFLSKIVHTKQLLASVLMTIPGSGYVCFTCARARTCLLHVEFVFDRGGRQHLHVRFLRSMWFWHFLVLSVEWVICLLVCGFTFSRRFWRSQEVQIMGNGPITTAPKMPALASLSLHPCSYFVMIAKACKNIWTAVN